jgi:uncharacterized protein YndB with AHSA1/START domain
LTSTEPGASTATATVEVALDPASAFRTFTEEIDAWWRRDPMNWNDPERAIGVRFEPGKGGRWIEVHDAATGEGFEMGRISVWEPGERLVFSYRDASHQIDGTEVEVRFRAIPGGTRVTVEHRGWERVSPDVLSGKLATKRWGWANILNWYSHYTFMSAMHSARER